MIQKLLWEVRKEELVSWWCRLLFVVKSQTRYFIVHTRTVHTDLIWGHISGILHVTLVRLSIIHLNALLHSLIIEVHGDGTWNSTFLGSYIHTSAFHFILLIIMITAQEVTLDHLTLQYTHNGMLSVPLIWKVSDSIWLKLFYSNFRKYPSQWLTAQIVIIRTEGTKGLTLGSAHFWQLSLRQGCNSITFDHPCFIQIRPCCLQSSSRLTAQ